MYFAHTYFCTTKIYKGEEKLIGKTVIITGGNAGIGKETAIDLARRGARVILGCRNAQRAEAAVKDIKEQTLNPDVEYRHLDLGDLDSVRAFANDIINTETHLDILINNAGILNAARYTSGLLTKQGFDIVFGTNYVGHFLLTYLLLDKLKSSPAGARIINVSSVMNKFVFRQLRFNSEVNDDGMRYPYLTGYQISKLANVMHSRELAKRLKGSSVTANAVHPGLINTEIFNTYESSYFIIGKLIKLYCRKFGLDAKAGAQTTIYAAVDSSIQEKSGKYFSRSEEATFNPLAKNEDKCRELWECSMTMCGLG